MEFIYYRSLLRNLQYDAIENVFENSHHSYQMYNYEKILFAILVLSYTYYIGERETLACITLEEQEIAKKLLDKWKNNNFCINFIQEISWNYCNWKECNLIKDVRNIMQKCERMPIDGSGKICILDNVTLDFLIFVIVLSGESGAKKHLLDCLVTDQNAADLYVHYLGVHTDTTRKKLMAIGKLMGKENTTWQETLENGFNVFDSTVVKKYKNITLSRAHCNHINFISKNVEIISELKEDILLNLKEKCSTWCLPLNRKICCERIPLAQYRIPVSILNRELIGQIMPYIETIFLHVIAKKMYQMHRVELYERTNRGSDAAYFELIKTNQIIHLVGPQFVFNPYDYQDRPQFDQLLYDSSCVKTNMGTGRLGLLLKDRALPISIEDLTISTRHIQMAECECEYHPEKDNYTCPALTGNSITYTKEELLRFIHDEYQILNICVKVNMQFPEGKLGYIVERT